MSDDEPSGTARESATDPVRAELAEVLARRTGVRDAARAEAAAKRHAAGRRTVRENLADLIDDDTHQGQTHRHAVVNAAHQAQGA